MFCVKSLIASEIVYGLSTFGILSILGSHSHVGFGEQIVGMAPGRGARWLCPKEHFTLKKLRRKFSKTYALITPETVVFVDF